MLKLKSISTYPYLFVKVDRNTLVEKFVDKILSQEFHWLSYHFGLYLQGLEHFLCASIINCCSKVEKAIPGYSEDFSSRLSSLSNKEKYLPHYEQIIQLLAELYVINHMVSIDFPSSQYIHEPTTGESKKNPELGIILPDKNIYIEVKCREFISHHNKRSESSIEIPYRRDGVKEIAESMIEVGESIVYPRDNTIKDFLISADEKFASFKKEDSDSITVIVIVWDDFIYEPISSLLNEFSGLLTEQSFYTKDGIPIKFKNIDSILLVRQIHHIVRATRDEIPLDCLLHPLDWGIKGNVMPKAYIPVNSSPSIDDYLCEILQAHKINDLQQVFVDYMPQDLILRIQKS